MGNSNRSLVAFGQHYSANWVKWHEDPRNPFTHWRDIVKEEFGEVSSPLAAFMSKPSETVRHAVQNLKKLSSNVKAAFQVHLPGTSGFSWSAWPRTSPPQKTAFSICAVLLAFYWLAFQGPGTLGAWSRRVVSNARSCAFKFFLILVAILPALISIALLGPDLHYLIIPLPLCAAVLFILLFSRPVEDMQPPNDALFIVAALGVLLLVSPLNDASPARQPNLKVIRFLRSLYITGPVNMLEAEGGYGVYVGENVTRVPEFDKNEGFESFLRGNSINVIVLSEILISDPRYKDDPEWHAFVANPGQWRFIALPVPGVETRIVFVKQGLISNGQNAPRDDGGIDKPVGVFPFAWVAHACGVRDVPAAGICRI